MMAKDAPKLNDVFEKAGLKVETHDVSEREIMASKWMTMVNIHNGTHVVKVVGRR